MPVDALRSAPECGARGSPLKTRRWPKLRPPWAPGIGTTNGSGPERRRRQRRVHLADLPGLPRRALLVFRAELYEAGRNGEFGGREAFALHFHALYHRLNSPIGIAQRHVRRVGARFGIQIDTEHSEPTIVAANERHASFRPPNLHGLKPVLMRQFELQRLTLKYGQRGHEQQGGGFHQIFPLIRFN